MKLFVVGLLSTAFIGVAQDSPTGSAPSANRQDASEQVYRVGHGVTAPRVISQARPNYPQDARKGHAAGPIDVTMIVGSDGTPRDVKTIHGISPELDKAAIDAAEKFRFRPASKEGKPVAVEIQVEFYFQP
jgi:periplasmic protein TonB